MGGTDAPFQLLLPPPCTTHGFQSTPAVTRLGNSKQQPPSGPVGDEHRPGRNTRTDEGVTYQSRPCLVSSHSPIQTMRIAQAWAHRQPVSPPTTPSTPASSGPTQRSTLGVNAARTAEAARSPRERVNEACGRVPLASTCGQQREIKTSWDEFGTGGVGAKRAGDGRAVG